MIIRPPIREIRYRADELRVRRRRLLKVARIGAPPPVAGPELPAGWLCERIRRRNRALKRL